jgi:hypothetical protein
MKTSIVLYYLFDYKKQFLDYSGGYGILTRMMRDIGFDYYWFDLYEKNQMACGFEGTIDNSRYELVSFYEVLEHLPSPMDELSRIFRLTDNLLFTTALLPDPLPQLDQWNYYGMEHGQHISFYSQKTFQRISDIFQCRFYEIQKNLYLFSKNKIAAEKMKWLLRLYGAERLFNRVKKQMKSRTDCDYRIVKNRMGSPCLNFMVDGKNN